MTSSSYLGTTSITLQFDLNRNIDGAARDVQAAINAARSYLPTNLPSNPTYRKVNPADAPIMILALTSEYLRSRRSSTTQRPHHAAEALADPGRRPGGRGRQLAARRARRGQSDAAQQLRLGPRRRRSVLAVQNANMPKGQIANDATTSDIVANDQLLKADILPAADRRLSQRRRRQAVATSPTCTIPSRISAPPA